MGELREVCARCWLLQRLHSGQVSQQCKRFYCATSRPSSPNPERVVLLSKSTDIYANLALEDWLYEKGDLDNKSYLLMWRNKPAVVIGRHQNPWLQANVKQLQSEGIDLARRKSGGGAVYHDEGNLNCSFIMHRSLHIRRHNLELVVRALNKHWELDLSINERNDIILNGMYKVSGTAAKLGGWKSYHHFTLLLSVDTAKLKSLLMPSLVGVTSNSTESVPAHVRNLCDEEPSLTFEAVVDAVCQQFLEEGPQQVNSFQLIDPTDEAEYPGVMEIKGSLTNPDWIFGKSPTFHMQRNFVTIISSSVRISLDLHSTIEKGLIRCINYQVSSEVSHAGLSLDFLADLTRALTGLPLWGNNVANVLQQKRTVYHGGGVNVSFNTWCLHCFRSLLLT